MITSLTHSEGRRPITGLSTPERTVLQHAANGLANNEIATTIHRSPETVKSSFKNILIKLGARTKTNAVAIAIRDGLITLDN